MDSDNKRAPGEAAGDGGAMHGSPTEVSWDGGAGRQPYANQGDEEQGPGTAAETEAGDRGSASGTNYEQMQEVRGTPDLRKGEVDPTVGTSRGAPR